MHNTKHTNPRITIICPVWNVEKYIEQMIKSVQEQTYDAWELLVMDGKSSDNTVAIVERFAKEDSRIRLYSEEDECSWHAVDKGFDLSRGDFICVVCGQDGLLDTNWFFSAMDLFEKDTSLSLVWGLLVELIFFSMLVVNLKFQCFRRGTHLI